MCSADESPRPIPHSIRPPDSGPAPPPRERTRVVPKNNRDGSVDQVVDWMKENLRNPESIRVVRWYPVEPDEKGYQVRCKYKIRMDGFGMAEERKIFFLDGYGKVYRTAGYKEAPGS